MARGVRLKGAGRAWLAMSLVLVVAALLAWWWPAYALDWQPASALSQPWRAVTAAAVHWSPLHLGANLLAAAVVAVFGWTAQLPARATAAWALSLPLGHAALAAWPQLAHYGGLSGTLHGAVAVGTLWLVLTTQGLQRRVGALVFTGLVVKLLSEEPWGPLLRQGGGWDIATVPLAHATGAAAGTLCVLLAVLTRPRQAAEPAA